MDGYRLITELPYLINNKIKNTLAYNPDSGIKILNAYNKCGPCFKEKDFHKQQYPQ